MEPEPFKTNVSGTLFSVLNEFLFVAFLKYFESEEEEMKVSAFVDPQTSFKLRATLIDSIISSNMLSILCDNPERRVSLRSN